MPVGELVNRYAVTNAGELKFRAEPSTKAQILENLKKSGVYVWVIRTEENGKGEVWSNVVLNGRNGYIMTKFLNLLTEKDSAAYDNIQETPAPLLTDAVPEQEPLPQDVAFTEPEPAPVGEVKQEPAEEVKGAAELT
jgi:hypothetical protein